MTKQEIIEQINQGEFSQAIKDKLMARVNLYPDNLEETHLNDFEVLVQELAMRESNEAAAVTKAKNHLQAELDKDELEFMTDMEDIAADAEATNEQMASYATPQS